MSEHRIPPAGDPFTATGKATDEADQPHACNGGWVSMTVETDDGETEEVLYLCRRCSDV